MKGEATMSQIPTETDVVVIGSGVSGLAAAVTVAAWAAAVMLVLRN